MCDDLREEGRQAGQEMQRDALVVTGGEDDAAATSMQETAATAPAAEPLRISGLSLSAVHVNAWVDWVFVHVECGASPVRGIGELFAFGLASGRVCGPEAGPSRLHVPQMCTGLHERKAA